MAENIMDEVKTYCEVHPDRETGLRCNKCNRLMCVECAVRTPVGYTCRECIRKQEDKFYKADNKDYIIAAIASVILGFVVGILYAVIPGWLWIVKLIVAAPLGGAIGQAALQLTGRRRGRKSEYFGTAGAVVGTMVALIVFGQLSLVALIFVGIMAVSVYGSYKIRI